MNIGITLHLNDENESIWTNGIKLNALYLVKALKAIGYNAYIINAGKLEFPYENKVPWDIKDFPVFDWHATLEKTDLMIWLGAVYTDKNILEFKSLGKNKKVIKYVCGNNYIHDLEACMFKEGGKACYNQELDEIWYVPQHEETNREYLRVLHNLPANKIRPVPFIWDPVFLDITSGRYNSLQALEHDIEVPVYKSGKKNKDKNLSCFEPNISAQKWHINNYLIVEDYLNNGGEFKKLNLLMGEGLLEKDYYISLIEHTTLFKSDPIKLTYQPRLEAVDAFAGFTDIVLAHQTLNPLNYSYLDALYLQFPLVHNAEMIKDAGYYYRGNNIGSGSRQLKLAIESHDDNIESYNENSERVLTRYTIYNEGLLETYKQLIETTMEIKDHKLGAMYDWKTNLYK